MKLILFTSLFFIASICYGQRSECNTVNDTMFIYFVEVFKPKIPPLQFWASSKQLKLDIIETRSLVDFLTKFTIGKNYCPDLPGSYNEELFKCYKDSAVKTIERLGKEKGNVYDLFDDLRKSSNKKEYLFDNDIKVRVSAVNRNGTFFKRSLDYDKFGSSSDEYPLDKSLFRDRNVFIPVVTFPFNNSTQKGGFRYSGKNENLLFDNDLLKYEIKFRTSNIFNKNKPNNFGYYVEINMTEKLKRKLKQKPLSFWADKLSDHKSDFAANVVLHYLYEREAMLINAVQADFSVWKDVRDSEKSFWFQYFTDKK